MAYNCLLFVMMTMATRSDFRYFAVALLPLTLFYCLVVVLQINIVSSHLNGIILSPVILQL